MANTIQTAISLYNDARAFFSFGDTEGALTALDQSASVLTSLINENKNSGNQPNQDQLSLANEILSIYDADQSLVRTPAINTLKTVSDIERERVINEVDDSNLNSNIPSGSIDENSFDTSRSISVTAQPPVPVSDDYELRQLDIPKSEQNLINRDQVPDQKQSAIDDEPDIIDTLDIGQDGLVVVPEERRNRILSDDPDKFRYNYTPGQYGIPKKGPVDSSNVTVKNTGFSLTATKVSETDGEITYKIKIENTGKNCLYLDQIIEISGTDLSNIDPDTGKSQLEPPSLPSNGISTSAADNTKFIKNFVSNIENLQSQTNAPFSVGVPKHLKQKDNQSEPLCSTKPKEETQDPVNQPDPKTDPKPQTAQNATKLQTETINEAKNWLGFYEDKRPEAAGSKTKGENKPNTRVDQFGNFVVDTSLMEAMFKYANWPRQGGSQWKYCLAFAFMAAYKAAEAVNDREYLQFLNEAKRNGLSLSSQRFFKFARDKGYVFQTPVPGCIAILQSLTNKNLGHAVIVGEQVQLYSLENKKWIFQSIQGNTSGETKTALNEGIFEKVIGFKRDNTARGEKPSFRYVGCIVQNSIRTEVGNSDEDLTKAFVTLKLTDTQ